MKRVVIASRGSKLALHQTGLVAERLKELNPGVEFVVEVVKTEADQKADAPLAEISGEGIFVKELEKALTAGKADLAVHSLKDMPAQIAEGLVLAAIPERNDPRDVLVTPSGKKFAELPPGARLGTASPRRQAQLKAWRPDLELVPIRGNIDTRVRKAGSDDYDGVVLAAAALLRLGWEEKITEFIPVERCLPAPGQGALAVESRLGDEGIIALAAKLDHRPTRTAVAAERAFLRELGGGCRAPIAALGMVDGERMDLEGFAASPDYGESLREKMGGPASGAEGLGSALAWRLLDKGARGFMARKN